MLAGEPDSTAAQQRGGHCAARTAQRHAAANKRRALCGGIVRRGRRNATPGGEGAAARSG
jgi:hypothetical protein